MPSTEPKITRRTQAERMAATRKLLLKATVNVLNRSGYIGATAAAIAEEAGVSRGAITYHFETRAQLMTEVLSFVSVQEQLEYAQLESRGFSRLVAADWPDMLWHVIGTPSGMAVIEILLASRNDPQLAELVKPAVADLEAVATKRMSKLFPEIDRNQVRGAARLFLWTIRGLVIAKGLAQKPEDVKTSLEIFRTLVQLATENNPLLSPGPGAKR